MRRIPSTQNMGIFFLLRRPLNLGDQGTDASPGHLDCKKSRGKVRFSTDNPYHCTSSWYEDWWKINYQVVKNPKSTCHWLLRLLLKFQVVKSFPFFPVKLINYSESCKSEWFFVAKVQRWPSLTGRWPTTRDCCICYSAASGGSCGCWDRRKTWKECCGRSFGVVLWPKCALKIWESNLGNWSSADLAQDMNVGHVRTKPLEKDRWGLQEIGFRFQ